MALAWKRGEEEYTGAAARSHWKWFLSGGVKLRLPPPSFGVLDDTHTCSVCVCKSIQYRAPRFHLAPNLVERQWVLGEGRDGGELKFMRFTLPPLLAGELAISSGGRSYEWGLF